MLDKPKLVFLAVLFVFSVFPPPAYGQKVLFLGDSLTAGYGLSKEQAYPSLVSQLASKEGYSIQVVNAGVSGDTSAGGLRRLSWLLKQHVDVLVIALGGNDALRGVNPSDTRKNLSGIINEFRKRMPRSKILLAGMKAPPNMGREYGSAFENAFYSVARLKGVSLMPFLLEGVAARPELNLPDRVHPNARGQQIMARNVWRFLKPLL